MNVLLLSRLTDYFQDESGWAWFIPLHNGTTSVGIVMDEATSKDKKSKMDKDETSPLSLRHYFQELNLAPRIKSLIGDGVFVQEANKPQIRSASDYSYSSTSYSGPNYRLVGDAAGMAEGILHCFDYLIANNSIH